VAEAVRDSALMTIGEVISLLRQEFPDLTISKVRFLESAGLVEPNRTPSGYRKFSYADTDRLRYILRVQRDNYLPLRVIKEHLDALDRGLVRDESSDGKAARPRALVAVESFPTSNDFSLEAGAVKVTRDELAQVSGLTSDQIQELESYGLLTALKGGRYFDADSVRVAQAAFEAIAQGLEPRHLRSFKVAADREIGLFAQVVSPMTGKKGSTGAVEADEAIKELAAISVRLHTALVRAGIGKETRR
jgi:DNA-binding transcriptional MerR regulator